ncbi:Retrovirus-related Pol polyprotein from transposon RE1-like protein [Drosera capensis]
MDVNNVPKVEHARAVCRLNKSIYGLKQALQNWSAKFSSAFQSFGFRRSSSDHSLFVITSGSHITLVMIYVDDMIITGSDLAHIEQVKAFIRSQFRIKDLGKLKYFLGIEVARLRTDIFLSQRNYILDILKEADHLGAKPVDFSMWQNLKFNATDCPSLKDPGVYRCLVGRLIYLTITQFEITFAINTLSQFMHSPHQPHMDATLRILRYLKFVPGKGFWETVLSPGALRNKTLFCALLLRSSTRP